MTFKIILYTLNLKKVPLSGVTAPYRPLYRAPPLGYPPCVIISNVEIRA